MVEAGTLVLEAIHVNLCDYITGICDYMVVRTLTYSFYLEIKSTWNQASINSTYILPEIKTI